MLPRAIQRALDVVDDTATLGVGRGNHCAQSLDVAAPLRDESPDDELEVSDTGQHQVDAARLAGPQPVQPGGKQVLDANHVAPLEGPVLLDVLHTGHGITAAGYEIIESMPQRYHESSC